MVRFIKIIFNVKIISSLKLIKSGKKYVNKKISVEIINYLEKINPPKIINLFEINLDLDLFYLS